MSACINKRGRRQYRGRERKIYTKGPELHNELKEQRKELKNMSLKMATKYTTYCAYGVCPIFLRVDISINEIYKHRAFFLMKVFYKKYVFIHY
jgi:hypothetical protein